MLFDDLFCLLLSTGNQFLILLICGTCSGPSTQFVVGDSPSAQMIDNEAVAPLSPTSTPELQVVEPSDPVKVRT